MPAEVREVAYLEDGDIADVHLSDYRVTNAEGVRVTRQVRNVAEPGVAVELGPYRYFMEKEIFEQPRAISETLQGIGTITPELFGDRAWRVMKTTSSVLIVARGGSYHAALTAKYWIESIARLPVHVEVASEFRYRDWYASDTTLVVAVSQSGETADVLGAVQRARSIGMSRILAICNIESSALVREATIRFITRAGIEIGVASTKAFTTQLVALFLLALTLARVRSVVDEGFKNHHLASLRHLPDALTRVFALEARIVEWSERLANRDNMLFLGRGMNFLLEKLKSNMHEVSARGGRLFVFADHGCGVLPSNGVDVFPCLRTTVRYLRSYTRSLCSCSHFIARGRGVPTLTGLETLLNL